MSANSGKSASVVHSLRPSDHALVCALARPSAIHLRTCSTGTGPYSLWSAPMILYIIVLSQSENTNTKGEVATNHWSLSQWESCARAGGFVHLGIPGDASAGLRHGKSSRRRSHQLLKLRFGPAAFNQRNRPFPAFNERLGFAGHQQCSRRVEQNGVALRSAIFVLQQAPDNFSVRFTIPAHQVRQHCRL